MDLSNGVLIYMAIKGARADVGGRGGRGGGDYMTRQPNITIFFGSTEAPDETAHGDWMTLVATMGCSGTRRCCNRCSRARTSSIARRRLSSAA